MAGAEGRGEEPPPGGQNGLDKKKLDEAGDPSPGDRMGIPDKESGGNNKIFSRVDPERRKGISGKRRRRNSTCASNHK